MGENLCLPRIVDGRGAFARAQRHRALVQRETSKGPPCGGDQSVEPLWKSIRFCRRSGSQCCWPHTHPESGKKTQAHSRW
ncbi:hypothetical protein DPMN_038099 [Dreissena polymorpha]|uniref:Uncharacterized protein n=1 Tax=Dreissena polymorpha TaxID=45954 RepID=A0A9D4RQD9_DREPO|nr:hypothetical protein DPMN_038099 [Dreissena polymorpha]